MNTESVVTWKRPVIWALGEDKTSWQWMVVITVVVIVAFFVGDLTAHRIWPQEWIITKPLDLPMGLARNFTLLGDSILGAATVDPLVLDREREEEDRFWAMAAARGKHYLYISEPWNAGIGIRFLVQNPQEIQPIAWERILRPTSVGWQGKYSPIGADVDREAWALDVEYHFDPSPLLWMLLILEGAVVAGAILAIYGFVVQPAHIVLAEHLAETK